MGTKRPLVQMRARHTRRPGQGAGSRGTRGRNRLLKASAGGGAGRSPRHVGLPTHGHGSPDTTERHRCYHRCCCAASEEVTLTAKRHTQTVGATLTPICPRTWRTEHTSPHKSHQEWSTCHPRGPPGRQCGLAVVSGALALLVDQVQPQVASPVLWVSLGTTRAPGNYTPGLPS